MVYYWQFRRLEILQRPLDLAGEYQKGETSVKKLELFEPVSARTGEFLSFRK